MLHMRNGQYAEVNQASVCVSEHTICHRGTPLTCPKDNQPAMFQNTS